MNSFTIIFNNLTNQFFLLFCILEIYIFSIDYMHIIKEILKKQSLYNNYLIYKFLEVFLDSKLFRICRIYQILRNSRNYHFLNVKIKPKIKFYTIVLRIYRSNLTQLLKNVKLYNLKNGRKTLKI